MEQDSMHIEMEREADRRAEERAAAAVEPLPQPSYPEPPLHDPLTDVPTAVADVPAATAVDDETSPDLDSTAEQTAAKVHITQVSDVIDPVAAEVSEVTAAPPRPDCGLPDVLVNDPKAITAYCVQHGVSQPMLAKVEYTAVERDCYERYCAMLRPAGVRPIAKDNFTAALRMFKKNYPLQVCVLTDLNTIKYHG